VTYRVRLSEAAQEHIDHAVAWLHTEAPHQVERFLTCFAAAKGRIADYPHLGHPADDGLRRLPMSIFQYQLWYAIDEREAMIVAVTHFRQDASSIIRRNR
jgi:plasmid stabilization system protein ParE